MIDNTKKTLPAANSGAVFNDSICPEKLTLETSLHNFRKLKKGIGAFYRINSLDTEDTEVQNMQFASASTGRSKT